MKLPLLVLPVAGLLATPVLADTVRCSFVDGPPVACTYTDKMGSDGTHRMEFSGGGKRAVFVGKAQSGWWSGTLDGKPAMGFERNRGNIVFSTNDLSSRFAWWYPTQAHGTY